MDLFRRQLAEIPLVLPAFALLDLPVEIGLSALSGDNYRHYFMAVLPAMTVLVGFLGWSLLSLGGPKGKRGMAQVWAAVLLIPLAAGGAAGNGREDRGHPRPPGGRGRRLHPRRRCRPARRFLSGAASRCSTRHSGHASPSRYFVIKHLFARGYSGSAQTRTFLEELQANPPAMIIDTRSNEQPLFYEQRAADCARLADPAVLAELAAALQPGAPPDGGSQDRLLNLGAPAFQPPRFRREWARYTGGFARITIEETSLGGWVVYRYLPDRP